jgi:hypothetical protein
MVVFHPNQQGGALPESNLELRTFGTRPQWNEQNKEKDLLHQGQTHNRHSIDGAAPFAGGKLTPKSSSGRDPEPAIVQRR